MHKLPVLCQCIKEIQRIHPDVGQQMWLEKRRFREARLPKSHEGTRLIYPVSPMHRSISIKLWK